MRNRRHRSDQFRCRLFQLVAVVLLPDASGPIKVVIHVPLRHAGLLGDFGNGISVPFLHLKDEGDDGILRVHELSDLLVLPLGVELLDQSGVAFDGAIVLFLCFPSDIVQGIPTYEVRVPVLRLPTIRAFSAGVRIRAGDERLQFSGNLAPNVPEPIPVIGTQVAQKKLVGRFISRCQVNDDFFGTDPPRPAIFLRDIEGFKLPLPVFFVLLDFDRRSVFMSFSRCDTSVTLRMLYYNHSQ